MAVDLQNLDLVHTLIALGADVNSLTYGGYTPYHLTFGRQNSEIQRQLYTRTAQELRAMPESESEESDEECFSDEDCVSFLINLRNIIYNNKKNIYAHNYIIYINISFKFFNRCMMTSSSVGDSLALRTTLPIMQSSEGCRCCLKVWDGVRHILGHQSLEGSLLKWKRRAEPLLGA